MAERECSWFAWIGGAVCDRCGKSPSDHQGIEWSRPGSSPFSDGDDLQIPWDEYGPGRTLNVPLFTAWLAPGALERLQAVGRG